MSNIQKVRKMIKEAITNNGMQPCLVKMPGIKVAQTGWFHRDASPQFTFGFKLDNDAQDQAKDIAKQLNLDYHLANHEFTFIGKEKYPKKSFNMFDLDDDPTRSERERIDQDFQNKLKLTFKN